ncbi:hypothetical protein ES703_23078 [subsurface metagenome]
MSLLTKAGITKISELEIDADKEMAFKILSKLGGLDKNPVRGDVWIFSLGDHANLTVKRLPASTEGKILVSRGLGKDPFWAWVWEEPGGESSLSRYYPALIDLPHDEQIVAVDKSHDKDAPIPTWNRQTCGDAPADYVKRFTPAVSCPDAEVAVTPDKTHNENAPIASSYDTDVA